MKRVQTIPVLKFIYLLNIYFYAHIKFRMPDTIKVIFFSNIFKLSRQTFNLRDIILIKNCMQVIDFINQISFIILSSFVLVFQNRQVALRRKQNVFFFQDNLYK